MTQETMRRAHLIEKRFSNAQNGTDKTQISSLYNKSANGVFELSREVRRTDGEERFLHTMSFYKDNGIVKSATLENGNVVRVEGFGGDTSDEAMKLKAKGLFHTLRHHEFSPIKPDTEVKPIGY